MLQLFRFEQNNHYNHQTIQCIHPVSLLVDSCALCILSSLQMNMIWEYMIMHLIKLIHIFHNCFLVLDNLQDIVGKVNLLSFQYSNPLSFHFPDRTLAYTLFLSLLLHRSCIHHIVLCSQALVHTRADSFHTLLYIKHLSLLVAHHMLSDNFYDCYHRQLRLLANIQHHKKVFFNHILLYRQHQILPFLLHTYWQNHVHLNHRQDHIESYILLHHHMAPRVLSSLLVMVV